MELWRDIPSYENIYQVSTKGKVRRIWTYKKTGERVFRKPMLTTENSRGYLTATFSKKNELKTNTLLRLMAETFVPNPENKKFAAFIKGQKLEVKNIKWVNSCKEIFLSKIK